MSSYPTLGVVGVGSGLAMTAVYFIYQMRGASGSGKANIIIEFVLGAIASTLLGFGTLFVMATFDLYV